MTVQIDPRTEARFEKMRPTKAADEPAVAAREVPPGPRLPALLQSVMLMRYRHQWIPALRRKYGDTFTITILPENRRMVFFHQPEHVREIFAGDPEIFHAGKGNAILGPIMGEHSLLLVDSSQHKRARRMLMPAFNGQAIKGYREMIADLAAAEVDSWTSGEEFESLERMNALTLEVILQVVFGVTDEQTLATLRPQVNTIVNVSPIVFLGWGIPVLQRFGPWRQSIIDQNALDRTIYRVIAERRAASDLAERSDVLSTLLQARDEETGDVLSDEELRDQLVTLLLAGHETTATALSWTLLELAKDPEQAAKARAAAVAGDDDYLEAVLKEAMRLHPVIPMVVRQLMAPATIGGVALPAGATVAASIILAHDAEASYPDRTRFDPGRFTRGEVTTNAWIPFGGGVRRCIGAGFSLAEGVAVLREVLGRFDVEAVAGPPEQAKVRNITSVPERGGRVVVRAR